MADLLIETSLSQTESALLATINQGLRVRLPTVADVPTLRATPSRGASLDGFSLTDQDLIFVTAKGVCYQWSTASQLADDGDAVVKPNDNTSVAGRWLKTSSTVTSGYLRSVQLYAGEYSEQAIEARIFGRRPCVIIRFVRESPVTRSQAPGGLYWNVVEFDLWCVSSNLRPDFSAELGSSVATEVAADPGVNKIVGALKKLLAGSNLNQPGIAYCDIGPTEVVHQDLDERKFVFALRLIVYETVAAVDPTLVQLQTPDSFHVQYEIGNLRGAPAPIDMGNFVASGYDISTGAGFTRTPNPGAATVGGVAVSSSPGSFTFAAKSDTYRDLNPNGTFTYVAVANGAPAPAVTSGALRVGRTVTDGSSVVSDVYLAPTLVNFGPPDQVPHP